MFARRLEDVARKIAVMRALFDDGEVIRFAEPMPYFCKLHSKQMPEQRPNAHIREVIAASANGASA